MAPMLLSTSVSFAAPARRAAPRRSVAARAAAPKKKEEVRFLPCRGGGVVLSARSWHGVSAVEGLYPPASKPCCTFRWC